MPRNEDGEYELVLGNSQLLIVFFLVIILLSVFFTMGYIVGRNSGTETAKTNAPADAAAPPARTDAQSSMPTPAATTPTPTVVDPVKAEPEKPTAAHTATPPPSKPPIEVTAVTPSSPGEVITPIAGQIYIQVTSVAKPEAEILAEVLTRKGFKAMVAAGPDDKRFRVLVGPAKDASDAGRLKGDLEQAGFKGAFPKKY